MSHVNYLPSRPAPRVSCDHTTWLREAWRVPRSKGRSTASMLPDFSRENDSQLRNAPRSHYRTRLKNVWPESFVSSTTDYDVIYGRTLTIRHGKQYVVDRSAAVSYVALQRRRWWRHTIDHSPSAQVGVTSVGPLDTRRDHCARW